MKRTAILTVLFLILTFALRAESKKVYTIDISQEIGSVTWVYLKKGLQNASEWNADLIVLHLNTYGGAVAYADSMRMAILNTSIPVVSFIDMNAASAGALISLACDSIYMRMGASIGAATVVGQMGEAMPDKYQSYMRSTMRSTAESQGRDTLRLPDGREEVRWRRDPLIAEAMVDDRIAIAGVVDSGRVLTFTAEEAVKHGYCEAVVSNISEIVTERFGFSDYTLRQFEPDLMDNLLGFLSNPAFQAILIMIVIGGIYFELQTPGIGFPLLASAVASVLYFSPLYLEGLAHYWEIALFLVGVILIALELFVIPGFGVAGVTGILCSITGLTLALIQNDGLTFEAVSLYSLAVAMFTVMGGITAAIFFAIYLSNKIGHQGFFKKIALTTSLDHESGFDNSSLGLAVYKGREGVTVSDCRPSGKIRIGSERFDAVSTTGFIESGTQVIVVRAENSQLYIKPININ